MVKPGQIERLLDAATQSLHGVKRGLSYEARKTRVDATLARYGIFTQSRVAECSVDTEKEEENGAPTVYVTVDVRLTAPDGSYSEVRTVGEGIGDITNASMDAAEQAQWMAISTTLEVDPTDDSMGA